MQTVDIDAFLASLDEDEMFDGWEMTVRKEADETITQVTVRFSDQVEASEEALCFIFVESETSTDCIIRLAPRSELTH